MTRSTARRAVCRMIDRHRPRAGYIDTPQGLVHVPGLSVPDHDGPLAIGFLAGRFAEREAPAERLPRPNPDWQAPRKFERRR